MNPTNIQDPEYFHKVVDCQYACPAHTPVPEYIRLIAAGKYTEAYMINWVSNVFPGVLGRTCDRPCEPACRRGRVEDEPVAICRLKRVAADNKGDVSSLMPAPAKQSNGKRIALIGGGPASLTVARDLAPLGYEIDLYDEQIAGGGMMRSQIPSFRLPETVLNEEVNYILDLGIHSTFSRRINSLKDEILAKNYNAVFVGTGAPRGKDLADLPGRNEIQSNIHIGIEWLANVAFGHVNQIGKKVLVIGGGNTAMDCCRTSRRLGGEDVRVVVRSPFNEMKASPWEIEDAQHEDIPFYNMHSPKQFLIENGKLVGMQFEIVEAKYENGKRKLIPTGTLVNMEADDVILAIGQENSFPWIERDLGIQFDQWELPILNEKTFQSTLDKVFFGGDAAFGPKNVITAVAQGHQAAISIDLYCQTKDLNSDRPHPMTNLIRQKMGIHEWSYDNQTSDDLRFKVPHADKKNALSNRLLEVELGFDQNIGFKEAQRCLNCDVQTIFTTSKCIECDACVDICPTSCITFTANGSEEDLRTRLNAPANELTQDLYVSDVLPTQRVMIKDENVCLHCGLCAERCPTSAWDMQKYLYHSPKACQL
ncbi:MAG TPA: FAD-dependent oxidoreductase [Saprospiraceae bacterium]|nr:FAD-dependent oxidoreductase [Saprospiraceae bacterium]